MNPFQIKEAKNGQFYFNIMARNGKVLATSEMYVSINNAERGTRATLRAFADFITSVSHTELAELTQEGEEENAGTS